MHNLHLAIQVLHLMMQTEFHFALIRAGRAGNNNQWCFLSVGRGGRADQLLIALEKQAAQAGVKQLFVLTTRTGHWFIERGFVVASPDALPRDREYNLSRQSRVLVKKLG